MATLKSKPFLTTRCIEMKISSMIAMLADYLKHSDDVVYKVMAYDPDTEQFEPVTGMICDPETKEIRLYTDD